MSLTIALAGNPNSGKTTLFNALTGSNQFVGNWPGVTVERKEGKYKLDTTVKIVDLPGIYSLSPYSPEEIVTRNFIIDSTPDVILNIIDGTNLERNLYLTTQLIELGIPVVVAINMADAVAKKGDVINCAQLSAILGCPVIEISAERGTGVTDLMKIVLDVGTITPVTFCVFEKEVEEVISAITSVALKEHSSLDRFLAIKLLEEDQDIIKRLNLSDIVQREIAKIKSRCEKSFNDDSQSVITNGRYNFITSISAHCYKKNKNITRSTTEKVDSVLTNKYLALPIFACVMFLMYYISISTLGGFLTDWINEVFFGEWIIPTTTAVLESIKVAPWLMGLIVDGIIGGVGAVLGFTGQLSVLFLILSLLETCGYMSRVAFIMDRLFRKIGLSGKAFIPMVIGSGCSVPAIMATRAMENHKDRKVTIITAPFIPCGAKLPIIALIASALFNGAWWVAPSAYFIGISAIVISGLIFKRSAAFIAEDSPFILELPPYHAPKISAIVRIVWERVSSFVKKAGTVILLCSAAIWFLSSFALTKNGLVLVENLQDGMLAAIGIAISPIFAPLGFGTWEATVATLTGMTAKENIVGTLSILMGTEAVAEAGLFNAISSLFTPLAGYSFLVFNLLCAPCVAAIAAIKKEMPTVKWAVFAVLYQTLFAYVAAFCVYQIGFVVTTGIFGIKTALALIAIATTIFFAVRPAPKSNRI